MSNTELDYYFVWKLIWRFSFDESLNAFLLNIAVLV